MPTSTICFQRGKVGRRQTDSVLRRGLPSFGSLAAAVCIGLMLRLCPYAAPPA